MTDKPDLTVNHRMARPGETSPTPVAAPMLAPDALEAYLLARRPHPPVVTIDGLDGYLTALIIGPRFIDPRLWLAGLVGDKAMMAEADTTEYAAIQAVVAHHNRVSTTLSEHPKLYRPKFTRHRDGGYDALFWWLGFTAGIQLAPRPWKKVTDPRQAGRALFEPIYDALSGTGPVPDSAVVTVAAAVVELREYFMPQRVKSIR
jgi:uncharacterized protein